ncbi:MAG: hypothetical protein ACK4P3_04680 [Fimbriimonadaceae bacterium]
MRTSHIFSAIALAALSMAAFAGPKAGSAVPAYHPTHIAGPDKGTETCAVCKYGATPAVQAFVRGDSVENILSLAELLNSQVEQHGLDNFRAFIIIVDDGSVNLERVTVGMADKGIEKVAVATIKPDSAVLEQLEIDKDNKNTIVIYRDRKVSRVMSNVNVSETSERVSAAISETVAGTN